MAAESTPSNLLKSRVSVKLQNSRILFDARLCESLCRFENRAGSAR